MCDIDLFLNKGADIHHQNKVCGKFCIKSDMLIICYNNYNIL
jgi:hypothetical protein